ncbi:hypothetical protein GJ496_005089 [Pomphorhynchus laevis]|nr:hypothetical protein GJ496_005089 [Pomphorhynchus laevis]
MMFNLALIACRPDVRQFLINLRTDEYIILFFVIEHLCFTFKYLINICVSDVTKDVQLSKSRSEFMQERTQLVKS